MLQFIKEKVKDNPLLFDFCRKISRLLGSKDPIYKYINQHNKLCNENVFFIQIGASDGIRNDPFREHILKYRWSGILLEPIPWAFNKLEQNYRFSSNKLKFLNAAITIGDEDSVNLYTFKDEFLQSLSMTQRVNYQQKTSFDRSWVLAHAPSEDVIEEIVVPSFNINAIYKKYGGGADIDLLAVDAEGMDADIIMTLDFEIIRPKIIFFEHHALGDKYILLMDFLKLNGYMVSILGGWDAVAELP